MTSDDLFTPEQMELAAYFAQPQFDGFTEQIGKIMQARPDLLDKKLIANAASEMLTASEEGVDMSVEDAVRLAKNRTYMTSAELAAALEEAGVKTLSDLERIVKRALAEDHPSRPSGADISERAEKLQSLAESLARNKDIILLGLPDPDAGIGCVWAKLAFLGGSLSAADKKTLTEMRRLSDDAQLKPVDGVVTAIFKIFTP